MSFTRFFTIFDYFFVLRPMLFFPGWSTMLAGYFIASKGEVYFAPSQFLQLNYFEIGLLFIIFAAAMGASFLLNQLEDIESDLRNKKLFFLTENHISKTTAKVETSLLMVVAIALSFYLNYAVLITVLLFLIVTGYAYNFKPFVLKDKPFRSLIANALMGWLAFALGWLSVEPLSFLIIKDSLPYLFFNTSLYFFTTLPDVPGDLISGKKTLAVIHGSRFVINCALLSYSVSLFFAVLFQDWFALLFILLSLPFYIGLFSKKDVNSTIKTTKYAILFFTVAIYLKIPFYFVLSIIIFAFTKWYFKNRFHYNYPNFKGE
jgi:4-hydroxybenzoate polyprenyltransferase